MSEQQEKKPMGFATLTPDELRACGSRGGKRAQENGTAHRYTSETAKEAGRKGGLAVSRNREHMAAIGRRGGARARQKELMNDTPDDRLQCGAEQS